MVITIMIFVIVILLTIFSSFIVGFSGLSIKRTVINIPFYVFESAVIEKNDISGKILVFDLDQVENNIDSFLSRSLKEKCSSYKFKLWPFKYDENNNVIFNDDYSRVEYFQLHFKGYYFKKQFIETYATYSIKEKVLDE